MLTIIVVEVDSAVPSDRSLVDWLKEFKETIGGDPLFERLVTQIWSVHRSNMKETNDTSTM